MEIYIINSSLGMDFIDNMLVWYYNNFKILLNIFEIWNLRKNIMRKCACLGK